MGVRPGYKQTEVGVIPEDWDVLDFDEACRRLNGKAHQIQTSEYAPSGAIPVIDQGQVPIVGYSDSAGLAFKVPDGGVLVFGDHTCIIKFVDFDFIVGADGTQLIASKPGQCTRFRAYDLEHTGIASTGYNRHFKFLRERKFVSPSEGEQRAIAAALSDVDALLDGLDRLIAKKRALKQATMQQLLTGQTRLPGFSGEWEHVRLGDHVTFLRNGVNSRAELMAVGDVRYLHYGDVHASSAIYMDAHDLPFLPIPKASRLERLRSGDLIIADASEDLAGVGKSVEIRDVCESDEVVSGLHTIAARFGRAVLADGFKGLLQHCPAFAAHLRRLAAGTKVYATNRAHVASAEVPLPSVDEQKAIARVLSDMDAELAALEARRDKTRDLKQAMMQELLTGRTRLA